jgi:hypothetical protein
VSVAAPVRDVTASIARLRRLALDGLAGMYDAPTRQFVFRVRRNGGGLVREGRSVRYSAIAMIGLAGEDEGEVRRILGHEPEVLLRELQARGEASEGLGDVALVHWALTACRWADREGTLRRLLALRPAETPQPTVELAWCLMALSIDADAPVAEMRAALARRLVDSARPAGVFPHVLDGATSARSHVSCFADFVYPIQALSTYHELSGDAAALEAALQAGALICRLQGRAGQWWWHYDARTGEVVEPYPVYAVHQDSMAPMALHALQQASGRDFEEPVARGLQWLFTAPELEGDSLIDERAGLIWRKVARREPAKLARYLQAAASRVRPTLRVPGLDRVLPPRAIDFEDRPYHLGWVLYTWPPSASGRQ